jgi:hypothetical protein
MTKRFFALSFMVVAILLWLYYVCGLGYVAAHFILKYW